ncbi:uncharacterized protein LOC100829388 isoform X4 [Brachypodium distachyon]|uniref:uncharacterized protein LOC100829388 isoform X4 n=1 Tax=Brachypodium distachyon TaxID=15368 RepID=UPI000D0D01F2|nr:uncharacterized protein LOC100829388 isoform X4 [Brachypodium distachyon]|eukprot:XP_024314114.1 uncharacterized protein LOC100829388 isoform X4 [Brachypodium distachyon]
MGKKAIRYAVVDAFAGEPFKGNPAAVCLLEEEHAAEVADERWMQSVAAEFNLSETAFLARDSSRAGAAAPRFHLRWFTPVAEVELCGHATLASAHFLFTTVLADHGVVEFMTMSGILTARKVPASDSTGVLGEEQAKPFIELDFPMIDFVDCNSSDKTPSIPKTLNGASIVSVHESAMDGDLIFRLVFRWNFCQEKRLLICFPTPTKLEDWSAGVLLLQDQHLLDLVMISSRATSAQNLG